MRFGFHVPADPSLWKGMIDLALTHILDPMTNVRVTESVRAEVTASRNEDELKRRELVERDAREELAAKKRKEKEESMKKMSLEQLRKLEEKERKRNQKKQKTLIMR